MYNSASSFVDQESGSMLAQLETIMSSVRREANELDSLKSKIAESDELKRLFLDSKSQLLVAKGEKIELQKIIENNKLQIDKLREDFRNLNDVCNNERMMQMSLNDMLQQKDKEIIRLRTELSYSQKECQKNSELRKSNQSLTNQITQKQIQYETDISSMKSSVRALESQLFESDKQKSEISGHFWRATEELSTLRLESNSKQSIIETLQKELLSNQLYCMELREMCSMSGEETEAYRELTHHTVTARNLRLLEIERLYEASTLAVDTLRNESIQQQAALQELQSAHSYQLLTLAAKEDELKAMLTATSSDLLQCQRDLEGANTELLSVKADAAKCSQALVDLTESLASSDSRRNELESLLTNSQSEFESSQLQLRTLAFRFQSLQTQFQEEQSQHWQALQDLKAIELNVTNENHSLVSELEEVHRRLDVTKKELESTVADAGKDVTNANTITLALRTELEKRIGELTAALSERDTLRIDFTNLNKSYVEMQQTYKQKETQFHNAMEQEFSKYKKEIQAKGAKLQSLEKDKLCLLEENSELMRQLQNYSKTQKETQSTVDSLAIQLEELRAQLQPLRAANNEQTAALEAAAQRESELVRQLSAAETKYNDEVSKLEGVVKVTKKVAAQQVNEVASRVRQKMEEAGDIKTRNLELENSLKTSCKEIEALKEELSQCKSSHSQMAQRMAHDVAVLRDEAASLTSSLSAEREVRRRSEAESLELRLRLTSLEADCRTLRASLSSAERQRHEAEEAAVTSSRAREESDNESRRLRDQAAALEESLRKKCVRVDELTSCLRAAESGLKEENAQLRKRLEDTSKELGATNQTLGLFKKENDEIKISFHRLQSTTGVTMTGLLTELRSTEATLVDERTNFQNDVSMYEDQLQRLKDSLETSRANLEDLRNRHRQERSQYDEQVAQLELEVAQLRFTLASRESRALELEKMFGRDKELLVELRETLVGMEHDRQDWQQQMERERQLRKRLEDKLMAATASHSLPSPFSSSSPLPLSLPRSLSLGFQDVNEMQSPEESLSHSSKVSSTSSRLPVQQTDEANVSPCLSPLFVKSEQQSAPPQRPPLMTLDEDDSESLGLSGSGSGDCFDVSDALPSPDVKLPLPLPLPSSSGRSNAVVYPELCPELWSDGHDVPDRGDAPIGMGMTGEATSSHGDRDRERDRDSWKDIPAGSARSSQRSRGALRLSPLPVTLSMVAALTGDGGGGGGGGERSRGRGLSAEGLVANEFLSSLPFQQDTKVIASMRSEGSENDFLPYSPNQQTYSEFPLQKSNGGGGDLADETIRRTQQYLNRRKVVVPVPLKTKKEGRGVGPDASLSSTHSSSLSSAERDSYSGVVAQRGVGRDRDRDRDRDREDSSYLRPLNLEAMPKYDHPASPNTTSAGAATRPVPVTLSSLSSSSLYESSSNGSSGLSSSQVVSPSVPRGGGGSHQDAKQLPKLTAINNKRIGKHGR